MYKRQAPIGVIGLCAQDGRGDLATARAAARTGVPMVASTLAVDPLEQVAAEFGDTPGFFQLYIPSDRALAENLVHRAEAAGFRGAVVTLDTWVTGWLPRDLATANFPQLRGHCLAKYTTKALALGATAVGVGRPYAYGLALEGTDGIVHVLRSLLAEADLIMAIDGYPTLADLRADGALRRI